MQGLAGDVIPVSSGFVIEEEDQAVIQASGAEVMHIAIDEGSQTDSGVADASEADKVRDALQIALCYMVVDHLMREQTATLATSFEDE